VTHDEYLARTRNSSGNCRIQFRYRWDAAKRAHSANTPEKAATIFGRSEFGLPPLDFRF